MKIALLRKNKTLMITTTAMLIAFGILIPQIFHAIPNGGSIFLPMHIPVLLCGMICGGLMGLISGIITPIISSLMFGMPPFPTACVPMIFELATYGLLAGIFTEVFGQIQATKKFSYTIALIAAMLCGRIVSIIVKIILLSLIMHKGTFQAVFTAALTASFVTAWIGILIQIFLIPSIMFALEKAGVMRNYSISYKTIQTSDIEE